VLIQKYGTDDFRCIEIDQRSVELLTTQHPGLDVRHMDVLQVDYPTMKRELNWPECSVRPAARESERGRGGGVRTKIERYFFCFYF
jgi:hypothetical protein